MSHASRFASYNVHGFIGQDGQYAPARTMTVIKHLEADVIALQEVQSDDRHGLELLRQFAAEQNYHLILGPTIQQSQQHHYGNAVLLRSPPKTVKRHNINVAGREPRGVIECHLNLQNEPWHLFITHLGLSPAERRLQTQKLLGIIQAQPRPNTALLGDINEWFNWGRPLRWLRAWFKSTPHPATFPARWPFFSLDRIWVHSPRHSARLYACKSPLCRAASDHLPLIAEIQITD